MLDMGFAANGAPTDMVLPQSHNLDPIVSHPALNNGRGLTQLSTGASQGAGYIPTWGFVAPPGFGDAPQHTYTTYATIPVDTRGTGDNPATMLHSVQAPTYQNQVLINQGQPIQGGNLLLTGLYTPSPMVSPTNAPFGGSGV